MAVHELIYDNSLHDIFYGFHRDFEDEIVRLNQATRIPLPTNLKTTFAEKNAPLGTNKQPLRKFIPRTAVYLKGDVIWWVLNNPNNYQADLFNFRIKPGAKRILYITDTFFTHFPLLKTSNFDEWDILITSLAGAVPHLQKITGRTWHVIPQGINLKRFRGAKLKDRVISISSFGRKSKNIHDIFKKYSMKSNEYYHYNVWKGLGKDIGNQEFYSKYAWELGHSALNVSFPRELTHPEQLGDMSLVSVRFFEAAASCTPIIGEIPTEPSYEQLIGRPHHIKLPMDTDRHSAFEIIDEALGNIEKHHKIQTEIYKEFSCRWTWEARVKSILRLL
jgi:hypothetical protein